MHNTHYIILNATDKGSAENEVDSRLIEWGTENNWFSIRRVVDLDDLSSDDKDYLKEELKFLNEQLSKQKYETIQKEIENMLPKASINNRHYLWCISQHYKTLYELAPHVQTNKVYTISDLKNIEDYYGFQYDEYGLTNISYDEDEHVFFVEVNMHS